MVVIASTLIERIFSADGLIPLLLVVVVTSLLIMSARRKLQYRGRDPDIPTQRKPVSVSPSSREQIRRDLETLLAELQDLSRHVSAEIDTRFAKLEATMRDADRRIAVLKRLAGDSHGTPDDAAREDTDPPDIRHAIVYELADAGASPVEIAKDLGKTPGEVELILNLRKKPESGTPPLKS